MIWKKIDNYTGKDVRCFRDEDITTCIWVILTGHASSPERIFIVVHDDYCMQRTGHTEVLSESQLLEKYNVEF